MVKKLFALASVTAVAGLSAAAAASGCSSSTTTIEEDGGIAETGRRDRQELEEEDEDCPINVAITVKDMDDQIGWKKAVAAPGACTTADITQIEANFQDPSLESYFDLGKGVSASCVACVISKDTDDTWQPIVGTADDNGQTGFLNFGACFGQLEGDDCGKSLQYEQFCYNVACNRCATTRAARDLCVDRASTGMCSDFGDRTTGACPDIRNSANRCSSIYDAMATLCGGDGDAGVDAGLDADTGVE